ncbi:MAG: TonB-dependent receptor [Bacteroidales bacterium]
MRFWLLALAFMHVFSLPGLNENNELLKRFTVSGYIRDASNGEALIGATVYVKELKTGTIANPFGFYSVSLPAGNYTFEFSYVGYTTQVVVIELQTDRTINIQLQPEPKELEEVVVTAEKPNANVARLEMSSNKLDTKTIRNVPALMGEVDLLKVVQMLPGVTATSEGTTNFSVRGGGYDQNLILLDDAPVYNASHLMGFFSVFNNDAIRDVKLYKGDIPASAGGRLSSLLDVRMKEGNNQKFSGSGGIGSVSSRLTLEGPVLKDRSSFIISGRRTYLDIFTPLSSNKQLRDSRLYFYDLTAKTNATVNDRNRVFLSAYAGRDYFKNNFASMEFGNKTLTVRWNHLFSKRLFANATALYSRYDYALGFRFIEGVNFLWTYNMEDVAGKLDATWYPNPENTVRFGVQSTYHILNPGEVSSGNVFPTYVLPATYSLEHAVYVSNEQVISRRLSAKYGLRFSLFQNLGRGVVYHFDDQYIATDSVVYAAGKIYNAYSGFEPRLGLRYELNDVSSLKASYSRTRQYYQMASNSAAGTPLDLWFSASPNVKPQIADQVAIGYFRDFMEHLVQASFEVYYKAMQNTIDFRDHAVLYGNRKLEGELRFGESRAYGAEWMVQVPEGRLNGWISYTFSHTERTIPAINNGKTYLAPYDKPHTVYIVINYDLSRRITIGSSWIYGTGAPTTFPVGRAFFGNVIYPIYSERNSYRLPDYHRLDVSITLRGKENPKRFWQGEWNFSVYNAYARKNTWSIQFVEDDKIPNATYAQKIYLFSVVPALTYNFRF